MANTDDPTPTPTDSGGQDKGNLASYGIPLAGGLLSYFGQKNTNESNVALGREQMQFQERMSSSAYQRAVADMKKAGINPMLVTQVGGASSPSGSMPQVQNSIGAGAATALQVAQTQQQMRQSQSTTENIDAQTEKTKSETLSRDLNTAQRMAEIDRTNEDAGLKSYQRKTENERRRGVKADSDEKEIQLGERITRGAQGAEAEAQVAKAALLKNEIAKSKSESDFYSGEMGKQAPYIKAVLEILRGVSTAYRATR